MKRVFIAGATGFVGSAIAEELLEDGCEVIALARSAEKSPLAGRENVRIVEADALRPESYADTLRGCDAAINSVGIIKEKKRRGSTFERIHVELNSRLLAAAREAGVGRYILISALGARPDGVSRYQTTKYAAEREVIESGAEYTIFRPSFVIGPGVGFVSQIAPIVRTPIVPIFGDGAYRFQPVDRRVLARCVAKSIDHPAAKNALFELRGARSWSYVEIIEEIGRALGKKKVRKIRLPLWLVKPMIYTLGRLPFSPISPDQFRMLIEGSVGEGRNAPEELGVDWIELPDALQYTFDWM